jgi:hypothetical protein
MWRWIKRWHDWAMNDLFGSPRVATPAQALHFSYEKAGLVIADQPIPWNAEAVVVEAALHLPPSARRKDDFSLRCSHWRQPIPADSLRRDEQDQRYHLFFRLPPPTHTLVVELCFRERTLETLMLPTLTAAEFLAGLRIQLPTLSALLGGQAVACQTFVATQCQGLYANAVLASPTSLVPLTDLDVRVRFQHERVPEPRSVAVPVSSSQLAGRTALLAATPGKIGRRQGTWTATWSVGEQVLATQRVRGIGIKTFQRSLRVCDTRVIVDTGAGLQVRRQTPPLAEVRRLGPCFLVASREPGMAGLCRLEVLAQIPGAVQAPIVMEQELLLTDGPTPFAPGLLLANELGQVSAFELRHKKLVLGTLPLCPAPAATFTSEGGFKPAPDFAWSAAADEELNERLSRLLNGR